MPKSWEWPLFQWLMLVSLETSWNHLESGLLYSLLCAYTALLWDFFWGALLSVFISYTSIIFQIVPQQWPNLRCQLYNSFFCCCYCCDKTSWRKEIHERKHLFGLINSRGTIVFYDREEWVAGTEQFEGSRVPKQSQSRERTRGGVKSLKACLKLCTSSRKVTPLHNLWRPSTQKSESVGYISYSNQHT